MNELDQLSKDILEKYPLSQKRCNEIIKIAPRLIAKIPDEFITIDMLAYVITRSPTYIELFPQKYQNQDIFNQIVNTEVKLVASIPRKYQTIEMWDKAIAKYPAFITYASPKLISKQTSEMIAQNYPSLINYIPKQYATQEMYEIAIRNKPEIISQMPARYFNQEICNFVTEHDISLLENIPPRFITPKMRDKALESLKKHENPTLIKYVKSDFLTEDICLYVVSSQPALIKYVPNKFINVHLVINMLKKNYSTYIGLIPFEKLSEKDRETIIKLIMDLNPEAIERHIPKKYITRHLANLLVVKDPNFINYIPKEFITDEMLKSVEVQKAEKNEKVQKILDNRVLELTITKELANLLTSGGTVERISEKYDVPVTKITEILERIKYTNPELYESIKNKLSSNQAMWVQNMVNNCNALTTIINSLGPINNAFISREQKIKFAYLYYKYCSLPLEDIYTFSSQYPDKIIDSNTLNDFFRKVLKYNYLKQQAIIIPEKKTIEFNNKWLKQFNKYDYFKIKDGIPTVKNQYLDHVITVNDVDQVINALVENGIPTNDMIVKEALRAHFDNKLAEFISELQKYDSEIADINKRSRN